MIHLVIGGSMSGKTTFVRKHFLPKGGVEDKLSGVPITSHGPTVAIGHYNRGIRTCGVDQMGRDYEKIADRLMNFITQHQGDYFNIVMEGNALCNARLLDNLKGWEVTLHYMKPTAATVSLRYKKLGLNYGRSIVALSYKRAIETFEKYREVYPYEIHS